MWIATVFFAISLQQLAPYQEPPGVDLAGGPEVAYGMLAPEFVFGPVIQSAEWSPTGNSIFIETQETNYSPEAASSALTGDLTPENMPITTGRLLGWDFIKRKLNVLYTMESGESMYMARWLPNTDSIVVATAAQATNDPKANRVSYGILNSQTGQVKPLMTLEGSDLITVEVSPVRALGALVRMHLVPPATPQARSELDVSVRFFGVDGHLGKVIDLPPNTTITWEPTSGLPIGATRKMDPVTKKRSLDYGALDMNTGKLTPTTRPTNPVDTPPVLNIAEKQIEVKSATLQAKANAVWLTCQGGKPEEAAVVTTDGWKGAASSKNNGVLFCNKAGLFVRRTFKMSRAAYDDHLKRVARQVALNQAKQVALALLMFSADYDDKYPTHDGDWRSKIDPYLRDAGLAGAFNYTFGGGPMGDNPAGTVLGFVNGPGGKAVAYGDGHVVWQQTP